MSSLILPLSNTQAKSLAGKRWTFNGRNYYFKDYDRATPGQPPWRSGAEGKAFPLVDSNGQVAAYLKFFTTASQKRLDRTHWLVAQQIHAWAPQLCAAPSAWMDSRQASRPDGVDFDLTGCLATAALGETWLELKYRLCENQAKFDKELRWQCLRDLITALARLEQADVVHGDLSPGNILVNTHRASGSPVLSVIDFDAFVTRTSGQHLVLPVSEGGTYGTAGYCPPDLVKRAELGDPTVAPYSDRHSRDMLLLELLLAGPGFPPEAPPRDWPLDKLKLRYQAFLGGVPQNSTAAIAHLQPSAVFSFKETERPSSTDLAKTLAQRLPPTQVELLPISQPLAVPHTKLPPRWTVPALALDLVKIEPGTFLMGSPRSEADRGSNEGPQTRVTISKGFRMGKYAVTQGQYEAVMGSNPSWFNGDRTAEGATNYGVNTNRPVEYVSWDDATNFCGMLTKQERQAARLPAGYVYRLPTEAEWEYACRAGTTTRFSFGDDPQDGEFRKYGWNGGNSGNQIHPVGAKMPNAWGLYDMHGNVWEWCLDWYGKSLPGVSVTWYGKSLPGASATDPKGPSSGSHRVVRGGSWCTDGTRCRSATRTWCGPDVALYQFGFRVVLAQGQ